MQFEGSGLQTYTGEGPAMLRRLDRLGALEMLRESYHSDLSRLINMPVQLPRQENQPGSAPTKTGY
jgi:hypothetical protein